MTACTRNVSTTPLNYKVDSFAFTNQDGAAFSLDDLKNKVWVAGFIFTSCTTVCPGMTHNLARLQDKLKEEGLEAELVLFSVDPEKDSPEVLKQYMEKFKVDFTNWHALTGYSDKDIQAFARDSFKTSVVKDPRSDQVTHGTSFFLVDGTGTVLFDYDGEDPDYDKMIRDIRLKAEV
ncbi:MULTISPECIES: SCO family protein [unclassified Paenibacillus]|uniref:SCO family protein n=1 Tax=unclassified Paenibacillus TaxID=185978 RepID=UPI0021088C31|nr:MULTISPECIES: SCO family protein [unclassified Paenibacillus]